MEERRGLKHGRDEDDHQNDRRDNGKWQKNNEHSNKRPRRNEGSDWNPSNRRQQENNYRNDRRGTHDKAPILRRESNDSVQNEEERGSRSSRPGNNSGDHRNERNEGDEIQQGKNNTSLLETKKAFIEDTYKKPEILGRNKRMFGSLMGHLGLAKNILEKDSQKINKQQQLLNDITKKHEEENHRREIARQKEKKKEIYDRNVLEIQLLTNNHRKYLESLQYFLFTQTEPKIAWIPANHNKQSKELLLKRQEEVLRELAEREISDSKKLTELENRYEADLLQIDEYFVNKEQLKHRKATSREQSRDEAEEVDQVEDVLHVEDPIEVPREDTEQPNDEELRTTYDPQTPEKDTENDNENQ